MFAFEDLLLLAMLVAGIFLIGIPLYKLVRYLIPQKKNPLSEAKVRLEQAKLEVEAARLDKEREKLYNQMYNEVLEEDFTNEIQQQEKRK